MLAPPRAASNWLDACCGRLPESSESAGARKDAAAGRMEVSESVGCKLEKAPSIWLDLVTWTTVWVWCLPLEEDGDGLAKGEAAHAFPVFGRVVEPAVADAFWAAAALFAARLPTGRLGVDTLFCLESSTAPEAVAGGLLFRFVPSLDD